MPLGLAPVPQLVALGWAEDGLMAGGRHSHGTGSPTARCTLVSQYLLVLSFQATTSHGRTLAKL